MSGEERSGGFDVIMMSKWGVSVHERRGGRRASTRGISVESPVRRR
jgi:hypothetical protein